MDQPWESLDVDDSDLGSFLLPNRPFPPFAPCSSRLTAASISSRSPTPEPPLILDPPGDFGGLKTEGKGRREGKIPGPAGAVQSAMRRRADKGFDLEEEEGIRVVGTQEYLRRAVEGGGDQEDSSFLEDAGCVWARAIEFVRERGLVEGDGISIGMPLCNIKRGAATDKVSQVVAIIKSFSPNGLGDLLVTLKDPTGTISASMHRKVLLDEGFGKDIAVGAALILQKVAVFSPGWSSCYLNITLNNIVQVITQDGRLPSTRNEPTPAVNNSSNSDFIIENGNPGVVGDESSQTGERIMRLMMGNFRERENEAENDSRCTQSQQSKATQGSHAAACGNRRTINPDASTQGEPLSKANDARSCIGITRTNAKSSNDNVRGIFARLQAKLCSSRTSFTAKNTEHGCAGYRVESVPDDKGGNTNGKENQRQPSIPRTSIPEWTEKQLDELLEFE